MFLNYLLPYNAKCTMADWFVPLVMISCWIVTVISPVRSHLFIFSLCHPFCITSNFCCTSWMCVCGAGGRLPDRFGQFFLLFFFWRPASTRHPPLSLSNTQRVLCCIEEKMHAFFVSPVQCVRPNKTIKVWDRCTQLSLAYLLWDAGQKWKCIL